jgi:hypothetical protein
MPTGTTRLSNYAQLPRRYNQNMGVRDIESRGKIRHFALQRKLDYLDEIIDSFELDKHAEYERHAAKDDDTRDVEEAKQLQQMAREDYNRGEFLKAWFEAARAEECIVFGRGSLDNLQWLERAISEALRSRQDSSL